MNIVLRYATTEDASLIAQISRQTFYDTFAPDNTKEDMDKFLAEQFTHAALVTEVGLQQHIFILAFVNDTVAGYVKLRRGRTPAALDASAIEVARLYVMKEFIGGGVGKELMRASIAQAKAEEKNILWLCVWEKNLRAITFYKAWGFQKFGECEFVLGDDVQTDWMMFKRLNE